MKKILYIVLLIIGICVYNITSVNAFSVSANPQTVYAYEDTPVYVYVNTSGVYGNIPAYTSNGNVLAGGDVKWADKYSNGTLTYVFTAKAPGVAVVTVGGGDEVYFDDNSSAENEFRTITIYVIERPTYTEPIEINRTYSSNNNLLSLGIEGYEIEPAFDKETLEYDLEVDYTVNKINVLAAQEDETATINGIGEYELEEGKNTINVTVTAENGNEKTYVINVLVKELNPIEVKIDKEKYTLVKKADKLPELDNYTKSTIKIDGNDIPALKGSITKYTLVGLKDSKGDIALYIYNAKDKSYTLYNEIKFASISLYYMDNDKSNYKKTTIKIDGKTVTAYKKKGLDYYLIYGMNLKTGKVNWYTYDSKEGTIQMYLEGDKANIIGNNNYLFLVYGLGCICILLVIFNLTLYIKNKKMN